MITPQPIPLDQAKAPKLLDQVRDKIRLKHYSIRTEQTYVDWIKRFVLFNNKRHPAEMGAAEVEAFLTHLAVEGKVAASTQNQAKAAVLFLYSQVLNQQLPWLENVEQAKVSKRLPVVLTVNETRALLERLKGVHKLQGNLLYGTGMRLMEAMRLRVKDIDFERKEILIRDGKGAKDRVTMLPVTLVDSLQRHLQTVKALHDDDLQAGYGSVYLPNALERKYPNASREWGWQYVFPATQVSVDPRSGITRRHHLDEKGLQRAMKQAVRDSGLVKPATPHTLRHNPEYRIMPSSFL